MKTISVTQFCSQYNIPESFISSLLNYELIDLVEINSLSYIQNKDIERAERLMRMHYDLEINMEGLDVVSRLLEQIEDLNREILTLRNKIDFYE